MAPQAAASGESGVAHQALIGLQAGVGPDVSLEDARRGEAPAALHTLEGPFSRVRPGEGQTTKIKVEIQPNSRYELLPSPSPDVLFQVAGFLVSFAAVLALVRTIVALQVLLKSEAGVLRWDQAWGGNMTSV